jgi:hypothetical protein
MKETTRDSHREPQSRLASPRRARKNRPPHAPGSVQVLTVEERAAAVAQLKYEPTMAVELKEGGWCQQPVRRIAWVLAHPGEEVSEDEVVYSTCGNPCCVTHLAKFRP